MTAVQYKIEVLTVIVTRLEREHPDWSHRRRWDRATIEYEKGARE